MKISDTSGYYFYFSLDDDDFKKDYLLRRRFLNVFKKEFSGGKNGDRFWLKKMNSWAIKKTCRQRFQELLQKYFNISNQKDIFSD